jgi:hypothetical protein
MSDCKKCRDLFLEAYYKDLDAQEEQTFNDHISVCEKCRTEFGEISATLQFTSKRIRPEPPQEFWDSYEKRLAKRIHKDQAPQVIIKPRWNKPWTSFNLAPRWTYQVAAGLMLIVAGVLIGRMIFSPSVPGIQQASQQSGLVTQYLPETDLVHRSHDYIDRSKLILLALVNFDAAIEDPFALDLPFQKQISRVLVQQASLLKKELAESEQEELKSLIISLEVILLQIANLESENDFESIELVKEGINRGGILMRINLTDLRRSIKRGEAASSPQPPSDKTKI